MLAESCPVCHNPFFEYNGKRQCVVCQDAEAVEENTNKKVTKNKKTSVTRFEPSQEQNIHADNTVQQAAYTALLHTLSCITQEDDVHAISELSASSIMLTKVYLRLIHL